MYMYFNSAALITLHGANVFMLLASIRSGRGLPVPGENGQTTPK